LRGPASGEHRQVVLLSHVLAQLFDSQVWRRVASGIAIADRDMRCTHDSDIDDRVCWFRYRGHAGFPAEL
jgi:hypothetical protein